MDHGKLFVGLDYHEDLVRVGVEDQSGKMLLNRRCNNDRPAIVKTVQGQGGCYS